MTTKTQTLLRIGEDQVKVVGYRYIYRSEVQGGYGPSRQVFTLTLAELVEKMWQLETDFDWKEVEAALGDQHCWSKITESD